MTPDSAVVDAFMASPNHGERVGTGRPDILLLHYTGMGSGQAALDWLLNPAAQVSSHYFVWEDGRVLQLVPERRRAWHAGVGAWQGDRDLNSKSIGIEIVNAGHSGGLPSYPDRQIAAVVALARDILARHAMPPPRVLGHSDVAPGRKRDPGEAFPWEVLHRQGVGHWVVPSPIRPGPTLRNGDAGAAVDVLRRRLGLYGYAIEATGEYDGPMGAVVEAFQRHFRPARVDGIADISTEQTLERLHAAMARDRRSIV